MGDWDEVRRIVVEEGQSRRDEEAASRRAHAEGEASLVQRLNGFVADLAGNVQARWEYGSKPGGYPPLVVLLGKKDFSLSGPEEVATINVLGSNWYSISFESLPSDYRHVSTCTLGKLMDILIARVAEIVGDGRDRPLSSPISGTWQQELDRRVKAARLNDRMELIGGWLGGLAGLGVWVVSGLIFGVWGWVLGLLAGGIVGLVVAVFWPILLALVGCVILYELTR